MKLATGLRDGVLTLTLNRPEVLNALDGETKALLLKELRRAERDPEVRAVVLAGAGRAFSAGEDLKSLDQAGSTPLGDTLREGYNPIVRKLREIPKPVVARVHGVAAGSGFSLALAADIRLGSPDAAFVAAFARIGLVPDSGLTHLLPRFAGPGRAMEIALTGRRVDAREAFDLGILNAIHPEGELDAAVEALATALAHGPTAAYGLTKAAMERAHTTDLSQALEYEAAAQDVAGRTEDHREGIRAFAEKRSPRFSGR